MVCNMIVHPKTSADALEQIPRPIVMLQRCGKQGYVTDTHSHIRIQLLYAKDGLMLAQTNYGSWIVPTGYGLLIPNDLLHTVEMYGTTTMQSVYITPDRMELSHPHICKVIQVSPLLNEMMQRFAMTPSLYAKDGADHHLAEMIIHEIKTSPEASLVLPFPQIPPLKAVCDRLLERPADQKTIDQWAYETGMSRRSFTRNFRQETGISFDLWRQRLRHQTALILLAEGQEIQTVAHAVGYQSVSALKAMMSRLI